MEQPVPAMGRTTFIIHAIVGAVIGLSLLIAPLAFGGAFGFPSEPGLSRSVRRISSQTDILGPVLEALNGTLDRSATFVDTSVARAGSVIDGWEAAAARWTELQRSAAEAQGKVNVFVAGAITKNIAGEEALAPIGSLKQAGVVAITDDGHCVQNNELMRHALEYARMFNLPVLDHCQDYSLVTDGVMNEGFWSTVLGLRGWPSVGEDMIVARSVLLAETTGARVHCQHLSSAGSVKLIRDAIQRGVPVCS